MLLRDAVEYHFLTANGLLNAGFLINMNNTARTELEAIFEAHRLSFESAQLQEYGRDWTRQFDPDPVAVVWPDSTEQVIELVQWARRHKVALVPSGGRTGLSGGAMACQQEVVVSFDRMNQITDFNPVDRTVTCGPGVITAELQGFAKEKNLFYPIDFASSGSSQLGGNIASNAGGIKVLKYGLTRDWVAGLKVVTGQGECLSLNQGLIKNATGYDFRHLMVGSEGTLGFIVEATMRLAEQPPHAQVVVLGVPDLDAIMKVFQAFRERLDLTAFEFFSEEALQIVLSKSDLSRPFEGVTPYYVLLEASQATEAQEAELLACFERCVEEGWVEDGVISQSETQFDALWGLRERISESISEWTPYKNDIAVTISQVPGFLADIDRIVKADYPDFQLIWFGHIGDGNLHLNILKPESLDRERFIERCKGVSEKVYGCVQQYQGSVSAEHGVGLIKKGALGYSRAAEEIGLMEQVKAVFDPDGIMNPGKVVG